MYPPQGIGEKVDYEEGARSDVPVAKQQRQTPATAPVLLIARILAIISLIATLYCYGSTMHGAFKGPSKHFQVDAHSAHLWNTVSHTFLLVGHSGMGLNVYSTNCRSRSAGISIRILFGRTATGRNSAQGLPFLSTISTKVRTVLGPPLLFSEFPRKSLAIVLLIEGRSCSTPVCYILAFHSVFCLTQKSQADREDRV